MKKSIIFIFIIAVLLIFSACTNQDQTGTVSEQSSVTQNQGTNVKDTFSNVLKLGGKFKCSSTYKDGGKATIYVDKSNYRMEVMTEGQTAYIVSHMQPNGDICTFMWGANDQENTVIKMCIKKEQIESAKANSQTNQQVDQNVDVDCAPYTGNIDFNYPAGMKMMDMANLAAAFGTENEV